MKKVFLLLVVILIAPQICLADEKSDAEAAITEAESMIGDLNSMGSWVGPALILKMKAEEHLQMAKEAFDAGNYADAKKYAEMAVDYAKRALGLRAWLLLPKWGGMYGSGGSSGGDNF